jgi:CheY-like chemotaxis protein
MKNNHYKSVSILLVEDDDVDAMGIQRAFKKLKLANQIHRAKDGVEALEMLRSQSVIKPYILLLDLNMPRMGGLEMLHELRKDSEITDAVIFVLTTSKDDEDKISAYKEHIAGYIVKSKLDSSFSELLKLLDCYWRLIELPVDID